MIGCPANAGGKHLVAYASVAFGSPSTARDYRICTRCFLLDAYITEEEE